MERYLKTRSSTYGKNPDPGSFGRDFAPTAPLEFGFINNIAVLAITTHGDIQVRIDSRDGIAKPITLTIRPDMEVVGLQVVSPAVPNLLPSKNVPVFVKIIKEDTSGFNAHTTVDEMIAIVEHTKQRIIPLDDQPKEILKEVKARNPNYTDDSEIMSYYYHLDLMYAVKNYKLIPKYLRYNKEFLRENNVVIQNTRSHSFYDWKINVLNAVDRSGKRINIDLMDTLTPNVTSIRDASTRTEFSVTTLHDILEELYKHGVRKVIIMDFTCSVIRKKQAGVDSRAERYLALLHNRSRRGGMRRKKTASRNRKLKIRKTKKIRKRFNKQI